jgi:ubiquitin C-terminal hydrolase
MPFCEHLNKINLDNFQFLSERDENCSGKVGLANIGYTCYMNSALQCLSNIETMRMFFLSEQFKDQINFDSAMGSKGEVVTRFGELLHTLWHKDIKEHNPFKLWIAIGRANKMFSGKEQHDSQEFVAWLLDQLHEDLNRVKNKRYIEQPELIGKDHQVANSIWEAHLHRN